MASGISRNSVRKILRSGATEGRYAGLDVVPFGGAGGGVAEDRANQAGGLGATWVRAVWKKCGGGVEPRKHGYTGVRVLGIDPCLRLRTRGLPAR